MTFLCAGCDKLSPPDPALEGTTPPAGANVVPTEVDHGAIISSVITVKGDEARRAAQDQWRNVWVAAGAWMCTVEQRKPLKGNHVNLGFRFSASPLIGGEYWIAADVPDGTEAQVGEQVTIGGRIEEVQYITAGPVPSVRIVMRNVSVKRLNPPK